jgi:hypothetical protein
MGAPDERVRVVDMRDIIQVWEWDPEIFHRRVLELEKKGYVWQRETYRVTAEMDPETGEVIHLYTIDMCTATQGTEPRTPDGETRSK